MYFLSVIVLCFLFLETFGRPARVIQETESRDNSYRDSDSGKADDYQYDDRKAALKQFADDPASKADLDENNPDTNEERDHPHPDKDYLENDEEQSNAAHLLHDDVSNVKRTAAFSNPKLFHDERPQAIETDEYNEDDRVKPNHKERYLKQYHTLHNIDRNGLIRNRREIQNNLNAPIGTDEISTQKTEISASEDEETAIRRHVKKLSKEELEELLHSLSEDKRTLLKNIIDNSRQDIDSVSKREITKKAGANEENSLVGNEQSDTNKIQGGSANFEAESSMGPNFDIHDDTKKSDESMYSKSSETPNSTDKSEDKSRVLEGIVDKIPVKADNIENLEISETESKTLGNSESEKEAPKNDNKREVNSKTSIESESIGEEPVILKSSNKEDLYCSDNEALTQLWNEESSLFNDNKYKREACSDEIDAIKSLGESFPNADNGKKFKIGSDMEPLIRVKRDNPTKKIYKRDENVVSNLKVPYFSSALENNEEESDEGGEFQDDGFFDRGVHFGKSGELIKRGIDSSKGSKQNNIEYCRNSPSLHMDKNKLETDTAGLGSDTDVVLSGIEGVDDNMMYNSVARIRRTGKDNSYIDGDALQLRQENNQQIISQNENNQISEDNNNAARYHENDAFGSLPRNYEQDLGRFKRIRRLKQENNVAAVE